LPHSRIGDYEIIKEIARGGMGVVFHARQLSLNRDVALKMVLGGGLASSDQLLRFKAEAEAAARLDHPHIVPIYEIGEHEGHPYFSMKLIEGGSLAERMNDLALSRNDARSARHVRGGQARIARLISTIAGAVHHAHQRGLLHRDLKPGNILLEKPIRASEGQKGDRLPPYPFVADFGVARSILGEGRLTRTGALVGTPSYMAPEQAAGQRDLTTAADVYSLGAILYELLAGQPPFQAESPLATILLAADKEPTPPWQIQPLVHRELGRIALFCLAKEPQRRYPSAAALADDLDRWLANKPIAARPAGPARRLLLWIRRRPAWAALILLAIMAGFLVFPLAGWMQAQSQAVREADEEARLKQALADDRARLATDWMRLSLIEETRSQRAEGDRAGALETLRRLMNLGQHEAVMPEAVETILMPGVGRRYDLPAGYVNRHSFSGDGQYVAAIGLFAKGSAGLDEEAGAFGEIKAWRAADGRLVGEYAAPASESRLYVSLYGLATVHQAHYGGFSTAPFGSGLAWRGSISAMNSWDPAIADQPATWDGVADAPRVFCPEGTHVVTANHGLTELVVVDLVNRSSRRVPITERAVPVAFPDASTVIVHWNKLWAVDVETGQTRFTLPEGMMPLAISSDSSTLAACQGGAKAGDEVSIWNLLDGTRVADVADAVPDSLDPAGLRFSPRGDSMAFDDPLRPGFFRVWERRTGRIVDGGRGWLNVGGEWNLFRHGEISPDGRMAASAVKRETGDLLLWEIARRRRIGRLEGQHSPQWSADGQLLATLGTGTVPGWRARFSTGDRAVIRVWDVYPPATLLETIGPASALAFSPDGAQVLVDGTVGLEQGRPANEVSGASQTGARAPWISFVGDEAWRAEFPASDEAEQVVTIHTGSAAGPPAVLRPPLASQFSPAMTGQPAIVVLKRTAFAASSDGAVVAMLFDVRHPIGVGGYTVESALAIWQTKSREPPRVAGSFSIHALAVDADGTRVWAAADDGIHGWEAATGLQDRFFEHVRVSSEPLTGFTQREGSDSEPARYTFKHGALVLDPTGRLIYSASSDGRLHVDTSSESGRSTSWDAHPGPITALAVTADGRLLASGGSDRTVRLWNTRTRREVARWKAHEDEVTALAFSSDGRTLASSGAEGLVALWDVERLREGLSELGFAW
jgi:WD40 repeat protein